MSAIPPVLYPTFNVDEWKVDTTSTNNDFEVLFADVGKFNTVEAKTVKTDVIESVGHSISNFTCDENAIIKKNTFINDILPLGNQVSSYTGIVNSVLLVQLQDINGDPTGVFRILCLEYNSTKTTIKGVARDINGNFLSESQEYLISLSAFQDYYGRYTYFNTNLEPYFCVDYTTATNTTRLLFYINTFGSDNWDEIYPQTGNPIQVEIVAQNFFINESFLPKRVLSNPSENTLSFFNKDSTILADIITASTYNGLPSASTSNAGIVLLNNSGTSTSAGEAATAQSLFLAKNALQTSINTLTTAVSNKVSKSGDTMTGLLNCQSINSQFGIESSNFHLQSTDRIPINAGLGIWDLIDNSIRLYADYDLNSKIYLGINTFNKAEVSLDGLKLIDNTNCILKLQSGISNENRISFGDSTVSNRGRIHYNNSSNEFNFHTNSNSTPNLRMSSTGMTYNNVNHSFNSLNGATNFLTITSNGNVGIGGTSTPDSNLTIGPSGVNSSGLLPGVGMLSTSISNRNYAVGQGGNNNVFLQWIFQSNPANGFGSLSTFGGSNPIVLQRDGGNVAIGMFSPTNLTNRLTVNGDIGTLSTRQYIRSSGFISNAAGLISDFGASDLGFVALAGSALALITNGAERMRVHNDGNIGINQTNPLQRLHIRDTGGGIRPLIRLENSGGQNSTCGIEMITYSENSSFRPSVQIFAQDNNDFAANLSIRLRVPGLSNVTTDPVTRMTIRNNGNVGIGRIPETNILEVQGNASKTSGGSAWLEPSDSRIKENIEDANLDILYDNIKNIKLHYYRKIDKYSPNETDRHQIGVIAQELKEGGVYPKAVQISPLEKFKIGTELVDYEETDEEGNIIIKQKEQDIFEEMENFHIVNYDQLYKANLGATQKLIEKVEEQDLIIKSLINRLELLENKN